MAKNVAETSIKIDNSGSQIKHSNPATHPLPANAGQSVVAALKTVGGPNGNVQGQISGTSVVFSNPA